MHSAPLGGEAHSFEVGLNLKGGSWNFLIKQTHSFYSWGGGGVGNMSAAQVPVGIDATADILWLPGDVSRIYRNLVRKLLTT